MVKIVSDVLTGPILGTQDSDLIYATTSGIISAEIDAEGDDDLIIGRNINSNGVGIDQTLIDASGGDDQVWGLAIGENSIGIRGGAIDLGGGNDVLVAKGNKYGIEDALIDGGGGDDRFNVQDGTGVIRGGSGEDTLVLSGLSADYEVTPIDDFLDVVNIEGGIDDNTNILVAEVETFVFQAADGSTEIFDIEEYFG